MRQTALFLMVMSSALLFSCDGRHPMIVISTSRGVGGGPLSQGGAGDTSIGGDARASEGGTGGRSSAGIGGAPSEGGSAGTSNTGGATAGLGGALGTSNTGGATAGLGGVLGTANAGGATAGLGGTRAASNTGGATTVPVGSGGSGVTTDQGRRDAASAALEKKGMTWRKLSHDDALGIDFVRCNADPSLTGGDTSCAVALPILCLKVDGSPRPNYAVAASGSTAMPPPYYAGWAEGRIELTDPIPGTDLSSAARANELCAKALGVGYRMAEFHDGLWIDGMGLDKYAGDSWFQAIDGGHRTSSGGWAFYAYGDIASEGSFWVHINDQSANCWGAD